MLVSIITHWNQETSLSSWTIFCKSDVTFLLLFIYTDIHSPTCKQMCTYLCIHRYTNTHTVCHSIISTAIFLAQRVLLLIQKAHLNHPKSVCWVITLLKGDRGMKGIAVSGRESCLKQIHQVRLDSSLHPHQEKAMEEAAFEDREWAYFQAPLMCTWRKYRVLMFIPL